MKACFNTSVLFLSPSTKYWSFVFFKTLQILCLWEVGSWLSIFSTLRSLGGTAYMKLIYTHTEVRQKHNAWPSAQQFQEEEQKTHTIKVLNIAYQTFFFFFFWGIELDKFTKRPLWDTYICFSWHWTISAPPNFTQARKKTINSLCKHCLNIVTLFRGLLVQGICNGLIYLPNRSWWHGVQDHFLGLEKYSGHVYIDQTQMYFDYWMCINI